MAISDYIAFWALVISAISIILAIITLIMNRGHNKRIFTLEEQKFNREKAAKLEAEMLDMTRANQRLVLVINELRVLRNDLKPFEANYEASNSIKLNFRKIEYENIRKLLVEESPKYVPQGLVKLVGDVVNRIDEIRGRDYSWNVLKGSDDAIKIFALISQIDQLLGYLGPLVGRVQI